MEKNIVEIISACIPLKKQGKVYRGLCPFHNEETGSFYVIPSKNRYYCACCEATGDANQFLTKYYRIPHPDIYKTDQIYQINNEAAKYYYKCLRGSWGKDGLEYFKTRGLSIDIMNSFGLGYAPRKRDGLYQHLKSLGYSDDILKESGLITFKPNKIYDKYQGRVIFPIQDMKNRVIGFGARALDDRKPKYINSPETIIFKKRNHLFGLNHAKNKRFSSLILCEGYMDVISLHQAGITNAVASLGTSFTPSHAKLLKRCTDTIYLLYDNDSAGRSATKSALELLEPYKFEIKSIDISPYKDPDEFIKGFGVEEFKRRIDAAEIILNYDTEEMVEDMKEELIPSK